MKSRPPKASVLFHELGTANLESKKAKIQHACRFPQVTSEKKLLFVLFLLFFVSDSSRAFTGVDREELC